jgi:ethanolamine utilization protein EutA
MSPGSFFHHQRKATIPMPDIATDTNSFSNAGRTLEQENEIELLSVGVDIGSSTSHIIFSRITMERFGNRYLVSKREVEYESDVLLTPYSDETTIDADALGRFIGQQYQHAGLLPDQIDTGALILTGVAVRRSNARAIGELFANQAGKFVAVSAGDALETTLVAYGSGAIDMSRRDNVRVMNVDIGGGTSKISVCHAGHIADMTVIDVGARIICADENGLVYRLEEAGRHFASEAGIAIDIGTRLSQQQLATLVDRMADCVFQAMGAAPLDAESSSLLRLAPLKDGTTTPDIITFSGGVSEYIYGKESGHYGDLGPLLAAAVRKRAEAWGPALVKPAQGIRATVIGASQYTIQVSGNTIYVSSGVSLPLRNMPVILPELPLSGETLVIDDIARAVTEALVRSELTDGSRTVAICYRWQGSATYARLDAFCRGIIKGMASVLATGSPLVLVNETDVGGLIGLHCHTDCHLQNPVISIDGIKLKEFDFIDIGAMIATSGAVPVVIKSLVFPTTAALGQI